MRDSRTGSIRRRQAIPSPVRDVSAARWNFHGLRFQFQTPCEIRVLMTTPGAFRVLTGLHRSRGGSLDARLREAAGKSRNRPNSKIACQGSWSSAGGNSLPLLASMLAPEPRSWTVKALESAWHPDYTEVAAGRRPVSGCLTVRPPELSTSRRRQVLESSRRGQVRGRSRAAVFHLCVSQPGGDTARVFLFPRKSLEATSRHEPAVASTSGPPVAIRPPERRIFRAVGARCLVDVNNPAAQLESGAWGPNMSGSGTDPTDVQIVAQRLAEIGDSFEQEFFGKKLAFPRRERRGVPVEVSAARDGEATRGRPWPNVVLLAWHLGVMLYLMRR
ncbi:hypothetical protein Bbelb_097840 [Branchiostoma belcheri]|nr:hypothetical protein Bbelb_097840 [Branchiostoma belcheri]